ncbi:AraC family transcriptional regulator [Marinilabiliaceae bacterium JC017]|nr:AraC family transcriptional regulator [Marinilabiliaceae bacterium JC017]
MYNIDLRFDVFSSFILLGVVQCLFLTYFFLKKDNRELISNLFNGLTIFCISMVTLDIWLNYTGYMAKIIFMDNFSEPFNFAIAPLAYLYVRTSIKPDIKKKDYLHFIPFIFLVLYSFFYFLQSNEYKFNSFLYSYHPSFPRIAFTQSFRSDPLAVRENLSLLILAHFLIYLSLSFRIIYLQSKSMHQSFHKPQNHSLRWLRNNMIHFFAVIVLFVFIKTTFKHDLGDYLIASYTSILIYLISFHVINHSSFFGQNRLDQTARKYEKSSLNKTQKEAILSKLQEMMKSEKYYINNMASLPHLAKSIGESRHHVSQVINEEIGKSFFEWLAENRIEEAKRLLSDVQTNTITIDELAEKVGYNSKSAFNKAFKKLTQLTPTQFRAQDKY